MLVTPIKTRVFKEGEDLFNFICEYIKELPEQSIVVVTSKIVALSEKRTAPNRTVQSKIDLIYKESDIVIPTRYVWMTVKDGMVMSSAGIDESNSEDGKLIMLPKDSFRTANRLRRQLMNKFKIKQLGVIVSDTRTFPLRTGAMGVAIGYAGFNGLNDYRGNNDMFGKRFNSVQVNIADGLTTAANLTMGEGSQQQPLAIIKDAPVTFVNRINKEELKIDIRTDLYKPLYLKIDKLMRDKK